MAEKKANHTETRTEQLNARIDWRLKQRAKLKATREGRSIRAVLEELLTAWLNQGKEGEK